VSIRAVSDIPDKADPSSASGVPGLKRDGPIPTCLMVDVGEAHVQLIVLVVAQRHERRELVATDPNQIAGKASDLLVCS
jgi:hypothetical protein